ncbi:MAG: glycosyltransferase WbuB, partial [Burkholderiales bacterium]
MKLLIFSQYFSPENFIINDIARTLVAQGHEVVVATGKPNYPDGRIFTGYRAWGCHYERYLDS